MPMDGKVDAGHCGALNLPEWSSSMPKVGGEDWEPEKGYQGLVSYALPGSTKFFLLEFHHLGLPGKKGKELKCVHSLRPLKKCMNWGCVIDEFLKNHFRFTVSMAPVLPFCQGASCEALWYLQAGGQCWGSPEMPILLWKRAGAQNFAGSWTRDLDGSSSRQPWFFTYLLAVQAHQTSALTILSSPPIHRIFSIHFRGSLLQRRPFHTNSILENIPKIHRWDVFFYTKLRCVLISMVPGPFLCPDLNLNHLSLIQSLLFISRPTRWRTLSLRCSFRKWQPGGFAGRVKWILLHFGWWWFWYTVYIYSYMIYTYAIHMHDIWIIHFADFWQNSWILP